MSKLTACGKIAELSSMSTTAAEKCRLAQHQSPYREKQTHYNEGKAVAYSESYDIMKKEIERLRNRFQNGCLTMDDFNTENESYEG